jgi:uncharacterized protein YdgA (DUF945 family)
MTKLRIVLIAVAALLLGLPPVFGMLTETQVSNRIESLRANEQLDVTVESYERGWFSSRAFVTVAPPATDPAAAALLVLSAPMTVVVDFNHGPVSVKGGFFLGFSEMHARPAPAPDRDPTIDFAFEAQSTFGGDLHFLAQLEPFHQETPNVGVSFSGGRINGTLAGQRVNARAEAESLQYRRGAATLSVLGLRASADNELLSRYLMPGAMSVDVDRLSLDLGTGDSSTIFDASGIALASRTSSDAARERLDGTARLAFDRARAGSDTVIGRASLETRVQNLDVAALEAYSEAAARAAASRPDGAAVADQIEPAVLRLLAGGPSFAIETLRFDVNGEPFEASVRVTADPSALPAAGAADMRDLMLWARVLDGRVEITAAKPLAERMAVAAWRTQLRARVMEGESMPGRSLDALAEAQVGIALAVMSAQGLIEDTGTLYRVQLSLEDGEIALNGQPLPLLGAL